MIFALALIFAINAGLAAWNLQDGNVLGAFNVGTSALVFCAFIEAVLKEKRP